jgi:cobalt-zinc-cadmium efflux system outer membrane protein
MNPFNIKWLCIVIFILCTSKVSAQDTVRINIEQAEKQFLEKNMQLLAARCHIAMTDAAIVQAKVLNNPTVGVGDINFWHPKAAEELEVPPANFGKSIVFSVELEQVIRTAGKKKKLIDLGKVSKEIAIQEFEAFLLSLKTELKTIMYETIYLQSYLLLIQNNQKSVEKLVEIYKKQTLSGNVAKGELIRLQSSLIELEAELNEIQTELNTQYKAIKVLLSIAPDAEILILPAVASYKDPNEISLINLFEMAKNSCPEFLLSDLDTRYHEKLLRYEKAQRSPDIALKASYDRYGGVWKNFVGVGISFDIPVFDRNQGNIKMAKLSLQQSNYNAEYQKNIIQQEIAAFYNNYKMNYHFYKKHTDNDFSEELEDMFEIYSRNFLNRNISMLEYLDFMEAYRTAKQAILMAKKNLDTSFAELQFSVNNVIN